MRADKNFLRINLYKIKLKKELSSFSINLHVNNKSQSTQYINKDLLNINKCYFFEVDNAEEDILEISVREKRLFLIENTIGTTKIPLNYRDIDKTDTWYSITDNNNQDSIMQILISFNYDPLNKQKKKILSNDFNTNVSCNYNNIKQNENVNFSNIYNQTDISMDRILSNNNNNRLLKNLCKIYNNDVSYINNKNSKSILDLNTTLNYNNISNKQLNYNVTDITKKTLKTNITLNNNQCSSDFNHTENNNLISINKSICKNNDNTMDISTENNLNKFNNYNKSNTVVINDFSNLSNIFDNNNFLYVNTNQVKNNENIIIKNDKVNNSNSIIRNKTNKTTNNFYNNISYNNNKTISPIQSPNNISNINISKLQFSDFSVDILRKLKKKIYSY